MASRPCTRLIIADSIILEHELRSVLESRFASLGIFNAYIWPRQLCPDKKIACLFFLLFVIFVICLGQINVLCLGQTKETEEPAKSHPGTQFVASINKTFNLCT